MPFFDVALRQRACRRFAPDPVPDEHIDRILTAATHAPSAENMQPWVFVVITDAAARRAVCDIARELWSGGARAYAVPHLDQRTIDDVDTSVAEGFGGAPVLILVGADHEAGAHPSTLAASIYPCVQNLLLAAGALGYGSALTTLTTLVADRLRAVVGLPASVEPMAIVPIGRAARPLGPPRRRPVAEVAHRDEFGVPFP
ncbi:MAG: nitroreductase family protein [Acidimicrobiales bacterium]